MDFYDVLEKRRTVRDFSGREVDDETLERVLEAAFKAPTNDHLRQFEFVVVRGGAKTSPTLSRPSRKTPSAFSRLLLKPPPKLWTRTNTQCLSTPCPNNRQC